MTQAGKSNEKVVVINAIGPLQLFIGTILGQILFWLTVSLPGLLTVTVAEAAGAPDSSAPVIVLFGAGIGVVLCAAIGSFLGGRQEVSWWLIAGALLPSFGPLISTLLKPSTTLVELEVAFGFLCAGAALALGYWRGRRKRETDATAEPERRTETASSV